jgi:Fur family transcriptional regulator, zinc uptake regulator
MGVVQRAGADATARLAVAETVCAARGTRLTANRRDVLTLILAAEGPVTAYGLLDRLKQSHPGAVPPTVYRALDFLMEQGLVHKIERLNAYVGCVEAASHAHGHPVQFLICRDCGGVTEVEDDGIAAALAHAAERSGFSPARATVEVEGTCGDCAAHG